MKASDEKAQFMQRLRSMGRMSKETRNKVVCALLGHSKVQTQCFGYFYCSRCDTQVGDNLASIYSAKGLVIVGHNCQECRMAYDALTWKDKLYTPNPFSEEKADAKP